MKELEGDERTKEEHQKVTEGSEGFIEVLLDAGKIIARIEARLKITRIGGQMKTDKNNHRLVPQTPSLGYHLEPPGIKINLTKLQLPTFHGNICHWKEFGTHSGHRLTSRLTYQMYPSSAT